MHVQPQGFSRWRFRLRVLPHPGHLSSDGGDSPNNVCVWLDVTFTRAYPDSAPLLRVEKDSALPLADDLCAELLKRLNARAGALLGETMV